jgi:hypothetical protein
MQAETLARIRHLASRRGLYAPNSNRDTHFTYQHPQCGDEITLYIDRNNYLSFDAKACSVTLASAVMLLDDWQGQGEWSAEHEYFKQYINSQQWRDWLYAESLQPLPKTWQALFAPLLRNSQRRFCLLLPWLAFTGILAGEVSDSPD